MPKKVGGLSLTSPEDAMRALTNKWSNHALRPGQLNMQVLLRHRITQLQAMQLTSFGNSLRKKVTLAIGIPI